ncbi:MAG: hypothetical protein K1X75_00885 [Leptospirales bacterium]|nr:hypothetical protein [Leptospirales bacterium]
MGLRLFATLRARQVASLAALLAFCLQYPVPSLHRCPVLNPGQISDAKLSDAQRRYIQTLPACHQAAAIANLIEQAQSADPGSRHNSRHANDAPHQHDTCPICQSFLHLALTLAPLIQPLAVQLQTLYAFSQSPHTELVCAESCFLPPSRAPPIA